MNNWIATLFNTRGNLFGRRRNNRNMLWATLVGLGVSAAALGLRRNNYVGMRDTMRNMVDNFRIRNGSQNLANLTEFSKEMLPNNSMFKNK